MENLSIWSNWQKTHKILYGLFLLLFLSSCILFTYSQYAGKNIGLSWEVVPEIKNASFLLDSFQKGFFQFSVSADSHYIIQSFKGTVHNSPESFSYLILASILILLITGHVTASYTKGIWYYVALTVSGIFFFLLNLDVLEVFGVAKMYWTIGWFLAFGITTHIFHSFKPLTPIYFRYLIFTLLSLLFCFLSLQYSRQINPLRHLTAYGWLAPFFISLIYVVIISTDILAGFLYLVTYSKNAKKSSSLLNFIVISLFFLGNVCLTYLKNRGSIDWNIFYLEAPVLLIASSFLGIWSFKKKEPLYIRFADFSPATAIWYLAMAINCYLCYSFVNLCANDPLQEVFEDSIIFSHLTMGFMFMIFVVANFMGMMEQKLAAHIVMYRPKFMPFTFVRLIGLIGILAIVLYNNDYQYRQAIAGQYILKAETFIAENNNLLSEEYLTSALYYDVGNHKANYLLAMLLMQKNKEDIVAKSLLKQSMFKNPSEQAYASLGYSFLQEGDIIRSLEILREGKLKFPQSSEILTNLSLAFAKTDIQDSVIFYMKASRKASSKNNIAASNQLAFAIENNIEFFPEENLNDKSEVYNLNLLALLNKSGKGYTLSPDTSFLTDTAMSQIKAAFVFNLALNNLHNPSHFNTEWIDSVMNKTGNALYSEDLIFAKACRQYYSGNISDGIITLDQLQVNSTSPIKYNNILSNWLIQQDAPRVAMDFLSKAKNAGDVNASFGEAIASTFYLPGKDALEYWRSPILYTDSTFKKIAFSLYSTNNNVFIAGILPQLYSDPKKLFESFQNFPNDVNKKKALGRTMQYLNEKGYYSLAMELYLTNQHSLESEWQYLLSLKKLNLKEELKKNIKADDNSGRTLYLKAWLSETEQAQVAKDLYNKALILSPLFEEGVLDALNFLKNKQSDQETYEMLLTSVMLNQYSIPIQKAYTLQSVQANYFNFAEYSLNKLKDLMPNNDFVAFAKEVELKKQKRLSEIEWK